MYERFTDRARKSMQLANQEAQRLNHEYIGTRHMLLGLVKVENFATNLLRDVGVDYRRVAIEVEKSVQAGPDMITMGKLPQSPRVKKVIEYSMEESRGLHHNWVGTEHILLGLLREEKGVAAQVLKNLGVNIKEFREAARKTHRLGRAKFSEESFKENSQWLKEDKLKRIATLLLQEKKIKTEITKLLDELEE